MRFDSLASGLARIVEAVVGLLLILIVFVALAEVLFRYFFYSSIVWSAELDRFLFIWLTFLGGAAAVHHRMHFRLTLIWRALSRNTRARLETGVDAVVVGFALVLLSQGLEIISRTSGQRSSAILLPMPLVYTVIPLSGALIILFVLFRWVQAALAGGFPDPPQGHSSEESVNGATAGTAEPEDG